MTIVAFIYAAAIFGFIAIYLATGKKPWRPWRHREDAHGWDHIVGASAFDALTASIIVGLGGPPVALFLGAIVFGGREELQFRSSGRWDSIGYLYPVCASIWWSVTSVLTALVLWWTS